MAKLFDADGKEIEAFTAEEVEAKKKEALDAYIKANPNNADEIAKLKDDLKKATEALEGNGGGDEAQKRRLKEGKEAAEQALKDGLAKMQKDFDDYKSSVVGGMKAKAMKGLTNGDKDLEAKIELRFNNLTGYPDTEEGIKSRLADAYNLATGSRPTPSMLDGVVSGGARGDGAGKPPAGETQNGQAQRKALGVSDDAEKKYGAKADEMLGRTNQ